MKQFGIGQPIRRVEDRRFLTGYGRYLDDVAQPHQTHAVLLRSPHANARIRALDISAAAALPGVLAVLPALKNPTISNLSDPDWVAVNTIIEEAVVRQLLPKLKAAKAQGIVEYPLNKIIL